MADAPNSCIYLGRIWQEYEIVFSKDIMQLFQLSFVVYFQSHAVTFRISHQFLYLDLDILSIFFAVIVLLKVYFLKSKFVDTYCSLVGIELIFRASQFSKLSK